MLTILKASELPTTEAEILELVWNGNLQDARNGNDEAATLVLAGLAWHLQQNTLTSTQRMFLSDALAEMAAADGGKDRLRATKKHLLLGRRPGSQSRYLSERRELRRALNMWMCLGDVADVNAGCELMLANEAGAPDIRPLKRAYLKYRDLFRRHYPDRARNFA